MMLNRKGQESRFPIFGLILAVIVLVLIGLAIAGKFNIINFVFGLSNINGNKEIAGLSYVGVNLRTGNLVYYTGNGWKDVDESKEFSLNGFSFNPKDLKQEFWDFYVLTPRFPKVYNIEGTPGTFWVFNSVSDVETPKGSGWAPILIKSLPKTGLKRFDELFLVLRQDNTLHELRSDSYRDYGMSSEFLTPLHKGEIKEVVRWRDSILKGGNCEKIFDLKLTDGSSLNYEVNKVEDILYLDLEEEALSRDYENYKEGCFKGNGFIDTGRVGWNNSDVVEIYYTEGVVDSWAKLWWNGNLGYWSYQNSKTNGRIAFDGSVTYFIGDNRDDYNSLAGKDLYDGLIILTRSGGVFDKVETDFKDTSDRGVFIHRGGEENPGEKIGFDKLNNEFAYAVLDSYDYGWFKQGELNG